jgi:hypothetical protein
MMRYAAQCLLAACLLFALAPLSRAVAEESGTVPQGREQLVGTWRLISITRITPQGPESDPFYGDHCSGLLIYDPSGWMSVQIAGGTRAFMATPKSRQSRPAEDAGRESSLFDSYYAYYGTWTFDASRGTVAHTIVSSLYPGEQALTYSQEVRLRGSQMIFTVRSPGAQGETRQVKIWERIKPVD